MPRKRLYVSMTLVVGLFSFFKRVKILRETCEKNMTQYHVDDSQACFLLFVYLILLHVCIACK